MGNLQGLRGKSVRASRRHAHVDRGLVLRLAPTAPDTRDEMSPRNPTPLAGRTAVITGAGSGIGRGLAQRLSAHGCPVAIVDSNPETLAATAALLDGPTLMRTLDVRDRQGQLALAAEVREWSPTPIGAVFNNAGVALTSTVAEASL